MKKGIENINVVNRWSLLRDLRRLDSNRSITDLIKVINKLESNTTIMFPDGNITDDIFSLLERANSRYLEYNVIEETIFSLLERANSRYLEYNVIEETIPQPIRTELVDNVLVNPLGLSESEKWFNTLTDEQKNYVQDLSLNVFFIVCTS